MVFLNGHKLNKILTQWLPQMCRAMRKCVLCHMRTTKAQIRLRILISAFVVRCLDSIISLDSIAKISRL